MKLIMLYNKHMKFNQDAAPISEEKKRCMLDIIADRPFYDPITLPLTEIVGDSFTISKTEQNLILLKLVEDGIIEKIEHHKDGSVSFKRTGKGPDA